MMMTLVIIMAGIFASGQSLTPRILEDGFRLMPTSFPFKVKSVSYETNSSNQVAKSSKVNAEQATYQVDFVLDFDPAIQSALIIGLYNEENNIDNHTLGLHQLMNGSNVLTVPGGIYDIFVAFDGYDHDRVVIREQVEINENMQLNFAASEATNHIRFQTLTADGEPVFTGIGGFDENWNFVQLQPGNADDVWYQKKIYCMDYGEIFVTTGNFGMITEEENVDPLTLYTHADFFVNDVSDRYTFYSYRVQVNGNARDMYTSTYEVDGAQGDIMIANDPAKYQSFFEDPCMVEKQPDEVLIPSFQFFAKNEKVPQYLASLITYEIPLNQGETCRYHISAQAEDSKAGYIPFIQPQNAVQTIEHQPWGDMVNLTWNLISMPLVKTMDQLVFANNGPGSYGGYFVPNFDFKEFDEDGNKVDYFSWPSHPVFTYSVDKKIGDLGNNCPVLVSALGQALYTIGTNENGEPRTMPVLVNTFDYIGRYGEKQLIVTRNTTADYKVNGEDFVSITGSNSSMLNELINGEVDATIVNDAVDVDGLAGSNKTQVHYLAGAEDQTPPTMTMLHFKGDNGDVTDRFVSADEGVLEFTAGDFNMLFTPQNAQYFDRQMLETVIVSYSPYGEDNWNELSVAEVPENYWPTMGGFYTAPLASVTGEAYEGWFDLKIRLTDAAGNWQEQVLSPAFRIDDLAYSSVANIGSDNAHEVARYSIDGKRVDASHRGVTIIKMSDGTARKIIK